MAYVCARARALRYFTWTFAQKRTARIIISHYGTYTRVHLLNSTYAIGYNVPFLSAIKSNANHLAGRTVHLVSPVVAVRARIHHENRSFRSTGLRRKNNGDHSFFRP